MSFYIEIENYDEKGPRTILVHSFHEASGIDKNLYFPGVHVSVAYVAGESLSQKVRLIAGYNELKKASKDFITKGKILSFTRV